MTKLLRGTELRYVLTATLLELDVLSVAELVNELARQGFTVKGRPSKTVSDALRWEIGRGRVFPRGRDGRAVTYGPGVIPRSTEHRIWKRVEALRRETDPSQSLRGGHTGALDSNGDASDAWDSGRGDY